MKKLVPGQKFKTALHDLTASYTLACSKIKSLNFEWVIGEELPCGWVHGLRTPNEGINLKFWADVADKICFGRIYKSGIEF